MMPRNVKDFMVGHNITEAMYLELLKADPFAYGYTPGQALDPNRFQRVTSLPFIPVASSGQKPATQTYSLTRAVTNSSTNTSQVTYSAKVTVSTGLIFTKTSVSDSVSWTSSTSTKLSQATNDGETVNLTQPSYGYGGPTLTGVYIDKVWKTFFFSQDYQ